MHIALKLVIYFSAVKTKINCSWNITEFKYGIVLGMTHAVEVIII